MEVVFILIGVVLGAVIGFLMGRSRSNALSVKLAIEEKELERVKSLMDELKSITRRLSMQRTRHIRNCYELRRSAIRKQ